jgi:amino acid adenylation domain-containing protein
MTQSFRLSPQQENLWLLAQADSSSAYRCRAAVVLSGELDPPALSRALATLVARHEILRTVCRQPRGMDRAGQSPLDPPAEAPLAVEDRSGQDAGEVAAELLARLAGEPLDPGSLPVLRTALARVGATAWVLALELPALCSDTAGMRHLIAELARAYDAARGGAALPGEVMQYADMAEWLNSLLEDEGAGEGADHWRRLDLSGLLTFKLPFERLPTGGSGFAPETLEHTLPAPLAAGLGEVARRAGVPLAAVLLAGWQVLLWHFVRQPTLIVGVAADGRSYEGLEEALGLLGKHLPVPVALAAGDRFDEVAGRAAQALGEALESQEYFTWAPVRKAMGHARGSFFLPVAFEHRDAPESAEAGGVRFDVLREESCTDRFRLKLATTRAGEMLDLALHFDPALIAREDMERLATQLEKLLEGVARDPETAIDALDILIPAERRRFVEELNATATGEPADRPVHRLFSEQAAQRPDAPAVTADGTLLTYGELEARANRLAHHLRGLGVGPESLIGLCVDRSAEMAVGVLGILKSGAAYVPLDPAYPEERLAFLLSDARMPVLVTRGELRNALPAHKARVVDLDADAAALAAESPLPLTEDGVDTGNAAYVIYTSGSTGAPRGVVIGHGNLAHYVRAMAAPLAIAPADRYLHTASVAFSSSVRQLLVPLCQGASVVMAGDAERRDPLALLRLVRDAGVTLMDLVPSHWRNVTLAAAKLAPEARRELLDNQLRLVVSASEPLLSDVPRTWRCELGHPARLLNMFGQTETTGIVATRPIEPREGEPVRGVPLGPPIADTELYLLDERLRPVAVGVAGRVHIGGRGLGRGYLGRPELTAERFVPHPLSAEPGARLYDTGDLARFQGDGAIEFLGRGDHQVKIRGLRVELGEIEAALGGHPGVREAVVLAREDQADDVRLVGYVVPRQQPAPSVDGLRVFLREKLPEFMVPSAWVILDELPLTPNGKIDRRGLPAPDRSRDALGADYMEPRDATEATLAQIWADLLDLDKVGVYDNFFKLGGHSLLGTVLMSRVRDAFSVELPVLRLFEAPTVAGLAAVVRAASPEGEDEKIVPVDRGGEERLLSQLDELSDDQVRALLSEMLTDEEAAR